MQFNSKVAAFAGIPAVLFVVGLSMSIGALKTTQTDFDRYIHTEQAVERGLTEMYAQGLQMGQALRNVILDRDNPKALENFKTAQSAYEKAFAVTETAARGTAFATGIQLLPGLRATHAQAQEKVLALIRDKSDDTVKVLNSSETPAWRLLRAELIKQIETAGKSSVQAQMAVNEKTNRTIWLSVILSVLATAVSVASTLFLRRAVQSELGGDPADAKAALSRIAQGDLTSSLVEHGRDDSLLGGLSRMQDSLRQLVGEVRRSTDSITTASNEIAAGSQDLSNRTEQTASNLAQAASSIEQLTGTVQQSADSSRQANTLASQAAQVATRGGSVVGQVVSTMDEINTSSRKIQDIISVIDGIAFQTNILALNAAVEAARAGEQGRGFAVVASEVRSLAGRSAEAAKEIKNLISASVDRVEAGSKLVSDAGATMTEIVQSVQHVSQIIGEVTSAIAQQSGDISQVNSSVEQLDQMTQQNAALVEQSAAAAMSLREQAQSLNELVRTFKL